MKRIFYLLFCFASAPFIASSQVDSSNAWGTLGGISQNSFARSAVPTLDGGYIVAASTLANDGDVSGNHGGEDAWIIKLGKTGNLEWKKCYGGTGNDLANAIRPTADSGYIVAGASSSNDGDVSGNNGGTDCWLLKLDKAGNILWQKSLGGAGDDGANCVQVTPDGGYIVAGWYGGDSWVLKLDNSGNMQWQVKRGADVANYIQLVKDSGYVAALKTGLIKLDKSGNINWQKTTDTTFTCVQPIDSGYIAVANFQQYSYIVKLDTGGNIIWQKGLTAHNYGPWPISVNSIAVITGGYVVAGSHGSFESGSVGWVARLDSAGSILKEINQTTDVGGDNNSGANTAGLLLFSVETAPDGDYIIAGYKSTYKVDSTFVYKAYIFKVSAASLPITLLNFTASKQNNTVLLQWLTAAELNSSYFNIQRSTDAQNFTTIGKVTAAGNSTAMHSYNYTDDVAGKTGLTSVLYYRLQQVDKDGKTTLSKTATIYNNDIDKQILVMPNPVKNNLTLQVKNYAGKATFAVYDMAGHKLQASVKDVNPGNTILINTSSLAAGTYIVIVSVNGNVLQQKFVKE